MTSILTLGHEPVSASTPKRKKSGTLKSKIPKPSPKSNKALRKLKTHKDSNLANIRGYSSEQNGEYECNHNGKHDNCQGHATCTNDIAEPNTATELLDRINSSILSFHSVSSASSYEPNYERIMVSSEPFTMCHSLGDKEIHSVNSTIELETTINWSQQDTTSNHTNLVMELNKQEVQKGAISTKQTVNSDDMKTTRGKGGEINTQQTVNPDASCETTAKVRMQLHKGIQTTS